MGNYLRARVPIVRLISYLLKTNKGMDEDNLIFLGEWHNGLHYPTQDGDPGAVIIGLKS